MNESSVPVDFPAASCATGLAGSQPKLSVIRDIDGKYRQAGDTADGRRRRYEHCQSIVDWAMSKVQKPSYAQVPAATLVAKLRLNLKDDFDLPLAEQEWVVGSVLAEMTKLERT